MFAKFAFWLSVAATAAGLMGVIATAITPVASRNDSIGTASIVLVLCGAMLVLGLSPSLDYPSARKGKK